MTKRLLDRCALVRSSFFVFMDRDEDKNAKREPGQYSAILTKQACSIRDLLYGIPRLRVALWFLLLGLPVFVANCILETRQDFWFLCFHCRWHFRFSCFLLPSRERNSGKSFCCHGKYFAKEHFCAPGWTLVNFFLREQNRHSLAGNTAPYYMASSVCRQDEPNPALWLAAWAGKMEWYYRLRIAHFVPTMTFH